MRDCANVEVRDALPELVHDRLPAAERERVLAHVSACVDCTAEVALLRGARGVIARAAPAVDAAAIARAVQARLAAEGASSRPTAATLQPAWASTSAGRARPPRWSSRPSVRAIAAALVMAIGFGGIVLSRDGGEDATGRVAAVDSVPAPDAPAVVPARVPAVGGSQVASGGDSGAAASSTSGATRAAAGAPTLALGESFADLSEDELAAVIDAINDDDARLPVAEPASYETIPLEPAAGREGGL